MASHKHEKSRSEIAPRADHGAQFSLTKKKD